LDHYPEINRVVVVDLVVFVVAAAAVVVVNADVNLHRLCQHYCYPLMNK